MGGLCPGGSLVGGVLSRGSLSEAWGSLSRGSLSGGGSVWETPLYDNGRMVRILLECILVNHNIVSNFVMCE